MTTEKPIQMVSSALLERLEIAILCAETLPLRWADASALRQYAAHVLPLALERMPVPRLLVRDLADGQEHWLRVDLLEDFPTPDKKTL
jgi:hypothetical protein